MVDGDQLDTRDAFIRAYDEATQVWGVAWNLSTGLYWAHPWEFLTLDSQSRHYINKRLGLNVAISGQQGPCDGRAYLKLLDDLRSRFGEDGYPVHSFPDLSLASWMYKDPVDEPVPAGDIGTNAGAEQETEGEVREAFQVAAPIVPYSVEDILKDGCFLERAEIDRLLDRLRTKKNIILQGPPGTGKTWLAKRLAFALMGQKDDSKVRAVQFHPNLSYEDFVRGWRPTGEGKLSLADGVFMEAIKAASKDPSSKFVVVIEEINRGNPAQIFGELPNGETAPVRPWDVAPTSIQLALARGHRWLAMLESGEAKSLKEIATREGIDNSYVSRMVNLTTLAPDIVAAILDDALPNHITLFDLAVDPPALWDEQRKRVGL